jgi:hypothetical protein
MPSSLTKDRILGLALTLVVVTLFVLPLVGAAQIISIYEWCEHDAERQLGPPPTTRNATLQLDSTPAIVCTNTPEPIEIPITPAVVTIGFAGAGAIVSLFTLIGITRRLRLAERR